METDPGIKEEQIYAQLRANVFQRELIYGSAMAFEPEAFEGHVLFGPYVYRECHQFPFYT